MSSRYYNNLLKAIINNSVSNIWDEAVYEWEIFDCVENSDSNSSCICGKENIRYEFIIKNIKNGCKLFPIGSSCIKKFERDDLNESASAKEAFYKLINATKNGEFITLDKELFSRKLLTYLYENGAFNNRNGYDPYEEYKFMLKMFNTRKAPSMAQQRKINAIIMNNIRPYALQDLNVST